MCNVDEGDTHPVKLEKNYSRKCVKCGEPAVVIIRIHDPFCKACFQVYVVHKFRSAIGKSKLIRDGEKVLVAISGGANSAALLDLIQDGLSQRAHKKLRFIPTLLHVDEYGTVCEDQEERRKVRGQVCALMLKSGFPSFVTDLEQCLSLPSRPSHPDGDRGKTSDLNLDIHSLSQDESLKDISALLPATERTQRLRDLLAGMASLTSREDLLVNCRTQTIVSAARQMGFSKVLTAECSTRLAVKILTDVSQGRGSQVALNTGFSDERNSGVMVIRPVRDLNSKELAMYNSLFGVDCVFIPRLSTKRDCGASIERLAEHFVTGLASEFPSTVSNIVRTSEKLGLPDLKGSVKCSFCQSPLDTNVSDASALRAVEYSYAFSRQARSKTANGQITGEDPSLDRSATAKWKEDMCYGCRLTLHNMTVEADDLPAVVVCRQQKIRSAQKAHIQDFLLDEENDEEECGKDGVEDTER